MFLSREEELGVSELARRLGLGKSTVHRLLTTLVSEGLVEQNTETGAYRLGMVMFELGQAVRVHMDLHAAVGPVLAPLREQTHESCQVGVLDGHEVVYVDRLESAHTLRLMTETGRRVPAHCTQLGQGAVGPPLTRVVEAVLAAAPLTRLTPHTIVDPALLRAELDKVRARGWAEAVEEREIGVASIAAPIRDIAGRSSRPSASARQRPGWAPQQRRRLAGDRRGGRRGGVAPARAGRRRRLLHDHRTPEAERADHRCPWPRPRQRSTRPAARGWPSRRSPTRTRPSAWPTATPCRPS